MNRKNLQNLKHIQVSDTRINLRYFPDFLIIGPHRCGTTWLYRNLSQHPQIFFPIQKEVHYFCEHKELRPAILQESPDLSNYLRLFHESPIEVLKKTKKVWQKYREFYRPIRGEATACYAVLEPEIIQELVMLKPDLKIILMIRNPIDRAWSHARQFYIKQKGKQLSEVPEEELDRFFLSKYLLEAGQYTKIIEKWTMFLQKNNLFIGFFDSIVSFPETLLVELFDFLSISKDPKYIGQLARQKINAVESVNMPEKYREMLKKLFSDELERLQHDFGVSWQL
jgi:hypothetical protein